MQLMSVFTPSFGEPGIGQKIAKCVQCYADGCGNQIRNNLDPEAIFLPSLCEHHTLCSVNGLGANCYITFSSNTMIECRVCTRVAHRECIKRVHGDAMQCHLCGVCTCCEFYPLSSVDYDGVSLVTCRQCVSGHVRDVTNSFLTVLTTFDVAYDLPCRCVDAGRCAGDDNVCDRVTHIPHSVKYG